MAIAVVSLEDNASLWEAGRSAGVTKFRWQTHPEMVQHVCPECMYYQDTVWSIDDPSAPQEPIHPLCACQRIPEFDPGTELGTDPDGEPIVAEAPPALAPGEYLRHEVAGWPAAKQDKVLGPSRGKLLRSGALSADELVHNGELRQVENLFGSIGVSRSEFVEMTQKQVRAAAEKRWRDQQSRRPRTRLKKLRRNQPRTGIGWTNPAMFLGRGTAGSLYSGEAMIARAR